MNPGARSSQNSWFDEGTEKIFSRMSFENPGCRKSGPRPGPGKRSRKPSFLRRSVTLSGRHPAVEGWDGNSEIFCDLARGCAGGQQLVGRRNLTVGHLAFAATDAAQLAGGGQAGLGALQGELAFHLGQAGPHVEEKATGGGAGVDVVGQTFKLDVLFLQLGHQVDQVLNAAAEAIEFPDDQGVAGAEGFQSPGQAGAVAAAAAQLVFEDLLAAGLFEGLFLQVEVLVLG